MGFFDDIIDIPSKVVRGSVDLTGEVIKAPGRLIEKTCEAAEELGEVMTDGEITKKDD